MKIASKYYLAIIFLGLFAFIVQPALAETRTIPAHNQWQENLAQGKKEIGFLAIGDLGTGWSVQYNLLSQIAEHNDKDYPAVMLLGDLVYPEGNPALFEETIIKPYQPLFKKEFSLYAVLGNHDWKYQEARYVQQFFQIPQYYTFQLGDSIQVWALNSNDLNAKQLTWLEDSLKETKGQDIWRIVILHHSLYSSSTAHGDLEHISEALDPIFEEYNVQLSLSGHNHHYERTKIIGKTTHIISGGGSASLYDLNPNPRTAVGIKQHHYLKFWITPEKITLKAINTEGEVIDHYIISK